MTDVQLLGHMKSIKIQYGFYDKTHKKIITPNDKEFDIPGYQDKYGIVLHPNEVEKYKVGTCWDIALYMYYNLKNNCKKFVSDVLMIYVDTLNPTFMTHTTVFYRHRMSRMWYWMEYSWKECRGIHGPKMYLNILRKEFIDEWTKDTTLHYVNQHVDAESILGLKKIANQAFLSICTANK